MLTQRLHNFIDVLRQSSLVAIAACVVALVGVAVKAQPIVQGPAVSATTQVYYVTSGFWNIYSSYRGGITGTQIR